MPSTLEMDSLMEVKNGRADSHVHIIVVVKPSMVISPKFLYIVGIKKFEMSSECSEPTLVCCLFPMSARS